MDSVIITAFADELDAILKVAEYAPGLPSRESFHPIPDISKPKLWEFGVHDHRALRRGRHFDLRLGDPGTGRAHSWALPPALPNPGEGTIAVQQPTHTVRYMDFEGDIPKGYGAGKVGLHAREKTEVLEASPEHVKFALYRSSGPQEFTLKRLGGRIWKLFNMTPTSKKLGVEFGKPKYKEISPSKVDVGDDRYLMSAKIDDAHNLFVLPGSGSRVRVVSYRPRAESRGVGTDLIEHTHKLNGFDGLRTPPGLGGTILRGGVYAIDPKTGHATEAHVLGGLLNSDVWKSREKQKEHGALRAVLYDVAKFHGRDVSKAPYSEKLKILREVVKKLPLFELPPMADTESRKIELLDKISKGKLPHTKEGVVLWRMSEFEAPIKAKYKEQHDVFVRRFFKAEEGSKYHGRGVGGFEFSHTSDGPIVGRVGTGLSDKLREDMHKNPKKYVGAVAVTESMTKYRTGALRAPAFKSWHLDKNEQPRLDKMVAR